MESSGGVLQDLAKREQVLSGKVQAARDQVASLIADAEGKAKAVLAKADADTKALESEYRVKREAEEKSILETSLSGGSKWHPCLDGDTAEQLKRCLI